MPPEFATKPGEYWFYYAKAFWRQDPLKLLAGNEYDIPVAVAALKDISSAFYHWYLEEAGKAVPNPKAAQAVATPPDKGDRPP